MLDIKQLREAPDTVTSLLQRRLPELSIDAILALDERRLSLLSEEELLRSKRNALNKQLAERKKAGESADDIIEATRCLSERVKQIETEKNALDTEQQALLLSMPNLPHPQTPEGRSADDNVTLRTWGDALKNRFQQSQSVLPHWDVATQFGLIDFERGVKIAKSRFSVFRADGARLARALIQFMLNTHTQEGGYEEISPPYLVNRASMTATGQLPKFEEDLFRLDGDDLFLIPTAEVPVTNLYAGEILEAHQLPLRFAAYTPCFRREAGSAGQDTRGLIRQHQFDKVELVKLVTPEQADEEYAQLIADAERILELLELPYRAVQLCAGDLGFGAARCVDLEVWMPAQGVYREISSCSHFSDFQARRANLKYRRQLDAKATLLHTINGSGLAVGRTVAAILENYQKPDGTVEIPAVLRPYFPGGQSVLKAFSA
ncbi:MAG: serine--tRNA ligase [Vampirovibrionales bacterium]|nr:serine--tRNA ligase [Vampirovibrionales bacterium]